MEGGKSSGERTAPLPIETLRDLIKKQRKINREQDAKTGEYEKVYRLISNLVQALSGVLENHFAKNKRPSFNVEHAGRGVVVLARRLVPDGTEVELDVLDGELRHVREQRTTDRVHLGRGHPLDLERGRAGFQFLDRDRHRLHPPTAAASLRLRAVVRDRRDVLDPLDTDPRRARARMAA